MLLQILLILLIAYGIKKLIRIIQVETQLKVFVQPPGHRIFQHLGVLRDKNGFLSRVTDLTITYGGGLRLRLGGPSLLIITDKELLRLLLGTSTVINKDRTYKNIESWLGTGLLTCKREKWEKTRRILTPAFHLQVLEQYAGNFQHPISILLKKLEGYAQKERFDVSSLITLCTLDLICETAMGIKVNAQNNQDAKYPKCVKEMNRIVQDRSHQPWKHIYFLYAFSKDFWKEKMTLRVLHNFTKDVIRKKRLEKDNMKEGRVVNKKQKLSFIDLLLESNIDDRPMRDEEIVQEVDTFMFAGHDTTASGISFTLYCLSKHKGDQDAIVEELQGIFGEDDRFPTFQDLQDMRYLNLVIKESLRLYPPVPIYIRAPEADVVLGKWTIPEKTSIAVFAYGVHRNPKYFPEPLKFMPKRFLEEQEPYTYLPFSLGSRNCIGQKFAVLEMKAIISSILRKFEVLPVEGYEPIPVANVVLGSTNGIQIKLVRRNT